MELARRKLGHLTRGIEIGASAIVPFPGVKAWNLEHPSARLFQEAQRALTGRTAPIHVLATAERLPIAAERLEFLLASHVIEHMPDTIRALGEWDRVIELGGVVFLIVPHRERTFDRDRPPTPLEHHLADFALATTAASDPMVPTSHYHVWRTREFLALLEYLVGTGFLGWEIEEVEDVDTVAGNGFTVVARKRSRTRASLAPASGAVAFHQLTLALPFQVPGRTLETLVPGAELGNPDVPRGTYHAVAVQAGFPPRVLRRFELPVGPPTPAPVLEGVRWEGSSLWFHGQHLHGTTWLEGRYPDGAVHRILPVLRDGRLGVDLAGVSPPPGPFWVVGHNLPPGGGTSAPLLVPLPG